MSNSNSPANKHNPRHDLRVPYSFFQMPTSTQVMYRIIRAHIDKYARCDIKHHSIQYSRWCNLEHTYIRCTMTRSEAQRVFEELYPDTDIASDLDYSLDG